MTSKTKLPQCCIKKCLFESEFAVIPLVGKSRPICKLHFAIKFYDNLDSDNSYPFGYSDLNRHSSSHTPFPDELITCLTNSTKC